MHRTGRVGGAFVLAVLLLGLTGTAYAQQARLRVDYIETKDWVEKSRIRFYVDLLDAEYRVIPALASADVEVLIGESKEPTPGLIEVTQFRETTEGVAVAIVMAGHNAYAPEVVAEEDEEEDQQPQVFPLQKSGVVNFIRKLEGNDKVAIFMYDERGLKTIDTFSSMFPEAVRAVENNANVESETPGAEGKPGQRLAPRLFTYLMQVIEDKFGSEEELPRRKILLLMSDGMDVNSGRPDRIEQKIKDIVQAARDYDVKIFSIGCTPGNPENLRYLKEMATKTGGVYREVGVKEWVNIPDIFVGIAEEIKKQYVIDFTTEELESEIPLRFRVGTKAGGRSLEAEYDKDITLGAKPFNWGKVLLIAGIVLGGIILLFIIIKVIGAIASRRGEEEEEVYQEYTGPSKGRLIVRSGAHAGEEHHLTKELTTIGSMPGNDIVLDMDDSCSKRHAGIKIDEMRYELADFGSTNGTFVNGRKINKQFLRDGDTLRIGSTEVTFSLK